MTHLDPRTTDATPSPSLNAPSTEQLAAQAVGGGAAGMDAPPDDAATVAADEAPTLEVDLGERRPTQGSGPQMTVTQAIRLNRSKRRTLPPRAPSRTGPSPAPAPARSGWKDGLFPAVFGAVFSARWVIQWVRDGQFGLAIFVAFAATVGLFAVGVGASRWLAEPAADAPER